MDDTEGARLCHRNGNRGDGTLSAGLQVEVEHLTYIHLVDMIAAEDQHQIGVFVGDDV